MSFRGCKKLYSSRLLAASSKLFLTSSSSSVQRITVRGFSGFTIPQSQALLGDKKHFLFPRTYMSASVACLAKEEEIQGKEIGILKAVEDQHGGIIVNLDEPLDSFLFSSMLQASLSQWREQGKKGVWIKLSREHSNLVDPAVKAGFKFHHAEAEYLMLVYWIPNTVDTLPANASHRISIGAFVMNHNRQVLVVQESNGRFSGKGIWKLPTGAVDEGEDICTAAVREVKEETGIDTEFIEVLAFRENHKSFFQKSQLFFYCLLQPHSYDIQRQVSEIDAAQWMPVEDYAAQPFIRENEQFDLLTKISLSNLNGKYNGFSTLQTCSSSSSSKKSLLYFNNNDAKPLLPSKV